MFTTARLQLNHDRLPRTDYRIPEIKRSVFVLPEWVTKNKEARVVVLERRCTTHHRRRSRSASNLCLHLGGSQGSPPSFYSSEQLRLESRPASGGSPVPRGVGAACARGIQACSGARFQAHLRSSITGGRCGLGGSAGPPGPQERPHHDPLQRSGDRQSRCGGESDSRLTRNSRENRSKVGSVMCKSLKRVGGKGGTRTLDPGIMSAVL